MLRQSRRRRRGRAAFRASHSEPSRQAVAGSSPRPRCAVEARRLGSANPITAADVNPFLLREAAQLADADGLGGLIQFRQANAEALAFEDNSYDCVYSVTVFEECDAGRAIAEAMRVVRPGGRVGLVVRALDMRQWWNLALPEAILCAARRRRLRPFRGRGCVRACRLPGYSFGYHADLYRRELTPESRARLIAATSITPREMARSFPIAFATGSRAWADSPCSEASPVSRQFPICPRALKALESWPTPGLNQCSAHCSN